MAAFRRAGATRVNAFRVDEAFLFKHYFEDEGLFARLERYYDEYEYRFEVPTDRFEGVRALLDEHDYALVVVDDAEPFAVVKRKYTDHPNVLFEESVFHRGVDGFNCFVMKDRDAAERGIASGATSLSETGLEVSI